MLSLIKKYLTLTNASENVFSCSTLKALDKHIERGVHNPFTITCGDCYKQSGVSVNFKSYKSLKQHYRLCHSIPTGKNCSKEEDSLDST